MMTLNGMVLKGLWGIVNGKGEREPRGKLE